MTRTLTIFVSFILRYKVYSLELTARIVQDTTQVFWSILEAGLCLLAVNLPSLWAYRRKISPDDLLASIRSAISLRSFRSGQSRESRTCGSELLGTGPDGVSTHSSSSRAKIVATKEGEQYTEASGGYDLEAQQGTTAVPQGKIMVSSTISQEKA